MKKKEAQLSDPSSPEPTLNSRLTPPATLQATKAIAKEGSDGSTKGAALF